MPRGVYDRAKAGRTDGRSAPMVSAVAWPALLASLEQQRAESVQEIADIDAVIATVRRRANGTAPAPVLDPARAARAAARATKTAPARKPGGHSQISDAQLTSMRTRWERGDSATEIAKAVKVSDATVYARAKAGGWKRPKAAKQPAGEQLKGSVRCNWCQTMTDYDPCRSCGKKLKRNW